MIPISLVFSLSQSVHNSPMRATKEGVWVPIYSLRLWDTARNHKVDTVVMTRVLCSIAEDLTAQQEMNGNLKPN
jgi:hypothetical protein